MKKRLLILAMAAMTLVPISASAAVFYGGWYRPYWGPYWGPSYYGYQFTGKVKLDTKAPDAEVFINGAFAGTTHENKTMHFRPGTYNIEVRQAGVTKFKQRVYVVAGKTLHLRLPM